MQSAIPKQFLFLDDKPVLAHTLTNLLRSPAIAELIIVVPAEYLESLLLKACLPRATIPLKLVQGGRERQDSVHNALQVVNDAAELILVQDGVRPFITPAMIAESIHQCAVYDGAVTAIPIYDTVKKVQNGKIVATLSRGEIYLAQTPQTFRRSILLKAYQQAYVDGYYGTDDATLVEKIGGQVTIIAGTWTNIKITCQNDLEVAKSILKRKEFEF